MNPETLALGVRTTIVGLGVVFIVLALLMFLTAWLDQIVSSMVNKAPTPSAGGAAPTASAPASTSSTGINTVTVAAIMAAVSAFSGKSVDDLVFTAINRQDGARPAWNQAGVVEHINTRQQYL